MKNFIVDDINYGLVLSTIPHEEKVLEISLDFILFKRENMRKKTDAKINTLHYTALYKSSC